MVHDNAAADFNLGLLEAWEGITQQAEQSLRVVLKADLRMVQAAYDPGMLKYT